MSYRAILVASALFALIASVAIADGEDHISREHRMVRITGGSLQPEVQHIGSADALGWVNYSSKVAVVSFDSKTARKMVCKSLGAFRVTGDRLESRPIQGRQFATLCQLAPGTYTYRVVLRSGAGGSGRTDARELEGTIVVD